MLTSLMLFAASSIYAQQFPPLPIDSALRMGKLENGLTYFIRHNEQPKNRAEFYIAQRVGSILEEDSQSGLAHFLEHMAFNGTKNFPGKALIDYLKNNGVAFGENLNAMTGVDETIYTLMNVPTTREGLVDSCLLILSDWSHNLLLEDKEIDEERGVIHEEWRTTRNANTRMLEKILPIIYPNNKYAHRLPIGTMEVVDNFAYQELRDYYHKWYRPDLQGIIVVGDVDVDRTEAKIKEMFGKIPMPENAAERIYTPVEDNKEPLVAIATDPEAPQTLFQIMFKQDKTPAEVRASAYGFVENYMQNIIAHMFNNRISEILQKPNAPFLGANLDFGNFFLAKTKDALSVYALAKEGELEKALEGVTQEIERVRQYGFTPSEYDRAKTEFIKMYETSYKGRKNTTNRSYANEYVSYFTDGGYIPGIETEYQLIQQIAPSIPLNAINEAIKSSLGDENIAILVMAPEKEGITYPTAEELTAKFIEYRKKPVEAYKEEGSDKPLMEKIPEAGKITSIDKNGAFGSEIWTLSNGIRVVVKPTDFKENQIQMSSYSPGGSMLYGTEDALQLGFVPSLVSLGGLGDFDKTTLGKILTGKNASVSIGLSNVAEWISGSSTPEDLETLLQLTYLQITAPRMDQDAYQAFYSRLEANLKAMESNPMLSLRDTLSTIMYGNNPYTRNITPELLPQLNYQRCMDIYKERFANIGDFTFFFIGDFKPENLKPYVETYLASLPTLDRVDKPNPDRFPRINGGKIVNHFEKELGTVKSSVINIYSGKMDYTLKNDIMSDLLKQILDQTYVASVREKEGGTYGVSVGTSVTEFTEPQLNLQTYFDSDPTRFAHLNEIVKREFNEIAEHGPNEEYLKNSKENFLKKYKEKQRENGYWLGVLRNHYIKNRDFHTDYAKTLESITAKDIQMFAKKLIEQGNHIEVVMSSKEK